MTDFTAIKTELGKLPPAALTTIVVRPVEGPALPPLDAKSFPSHVEYRKALIERTQRKNKLGIDIVAKIAQDNGLEPVAMTTLNCLSITGKVSDIISFLDQAPLATAMLNAPIETSLPKPKSNGPRI